MKGSFEPGGLPTNHLERLRRNRKTDGFFCDKKAQSGFGHADHVVRAPIGALKTKFATGNFVFFVANNSAGSIAS